MSITQSDPMFVLLNTPRNPFGRKLTNAYLDELDATGFWQADPSLTQIAAVAQANDVSRWGLLNTCIAHRMTHVPPNVVLVDRKGNQAPTMRHGMSLNWFAMLTGRSGAGKSENMRLGELLVPPAAAAVPSGTGQGFTKHLCETGKKLKDDQGVDLAKPRVFTRVLNHILLVHCPEIGQLTAEMTRPGSQTANMIRNIYVGETMGTTTGDRERKVTMLRNMSRVCLVYGSLHSASGPILAEYQDGTPQRFLWTPVREYRVHLAKVRATVVGGHSLPRPDICDAASTPPFGPNGAKSTDDQPWEWDLIPTEVDEHTPPPPAVWLDWSPQMRRDIPSIQDALNAMDSNPYEEDASPVDDAERLKLEARSHSLLGRVKAAAGIAFVCGRSDITDLDWQLSDVLVNGVSTAELSGMWEMSKRQAVSVARGSGHVEGIKRVATDHYTRGDAQRLEDRLVDAIQSKVESHVSRHGARFTVRDVQSRQTGNARYTAAELRQGLQALLEQGMVSVDGSTYTWIG